MMREMKDSGVEFIGDIPVQWEVYKIKYLGEYRNGLTYSPSDVCDAEGGTLVLRSSNVKNGKLVLDDNENVYVSCQVPVYLYVRNGDILICSRNGSRELIGKNAYIGEIKATFGAFMMIYRCRYPRYMFYVLNSPVFSYYLGTFFTATINQLTGANFGNMLIPFCPYEDERNRIVNFLDDKCAEIDALAADIHTQINVLEQYKRSVITEAVTKGLNPDAQMKDSGMPWIGVIPQHWRVDKVKYHLRRKELRNPGNQVVLSVYREYGVIPKDSRDDNHNVTSEDVSKYKYAKPGCLVINKMKAWQGSMGISEYEGIVSPAYFIYEFTDDTLTKQYLHHLFRTCYKDEFRRISGGIREGQWDLSPEAFGDTLLPVPPVDEQKEITDYLSMKIPKIEQVISQKQEQLSALDAYKKSLIYEYVTGKKEVV